LLRALPFLLIFAALPAALPAQTVEIYSEFARPDPFGGIAAPDRAWGEPREVLSPAVARNGFASFHVAISVPPKETYFLYVMPNPVSACRVFLYKEHFVKTESGWIPDRLTEVQRLPDFGVMPDPDDGIDGQTTRVYLLDLWLPPNADVARFRLEVQLKVGDWTVRPMEVRVTSLRVPELGAGAYGRLPEIERAADTAALAPFADYLAGTPLRMPGSPATVREAIRRNAMQDMALAAAETPGAFAQRALDLLRLNSGFTVRPYGAEWWLRLRDWIFAAH
jgi:hypothetical protein